MNNHSSLKEDFAGYQKKRSNYSNKNTEKYAVGAKQCVSAKKHGFSHCLTVSVSGQLSDGMNYQIKHAIINLRKYPGGFLLKVGGRVRIVTKTIL